MAILVFVMPLRSLSNTFPNTREVRLPSWHSAIACRGLYAGKYDFSSLVERWERASKALVEIIIDVWYLLIELSLRVSSSSSTSSCHILSGWYSITDWLPCLATIVSCLRRLIAGSLVLSRLAIVIEVIEHQIKIRVDILCKMVLDFVFLIDWYPKGFVLRCTLVEVLVCTCVSSRLREVLRTLWLLYQLLVHLMEVILILSGYSRYDCSLCGIAGTILSSRVESMLPHSLLWFCGSWPILRLQLWYLVASPKALLFHNICICPETTSSATCFCWMLIVWAADAWHNFLIEEVNSVYSVSRSPALLVYKIVSHWLRWSCCDLLTYLTGFLSYFVCLTWPRLLFSPSSTMVLLLLTVCVGEVVWVLLLLRLCRFLYKHLGLLITNNLILFNVRLPQLLPLGHLATLLDPLLLAHSHLLLLLSSVYLLICILNLLIRILVRVHIVDVYILALLGCSFIVYMSIARDSLDLLDDEFLRFALL
jgi:hypothetical protein